LLFESWSYCSELDALGDDIFEDEFLDDAVAAPNAPSAEIGGESVPASQVSSFPRGYPPYDCCLA